MANPNIFAQYLQPVRSVSERIAALDEADFRRAQMEGAVRQNKLQELAFQRGEQDRAAAEARANRLRGLATESGGDEAKYAEALRGAGEFGMAADLEKSMLERGGKKATIAGQEAENAAKAFKLKREQLDAAFRDVAMLSSPDEAMADLQRQVQAGEIDAAQAQNMARVIQSDPQWRKKMLTGLMQAKDQLDLEERQAARAQQGQQSAAQLAQQAELARMQNETTRRGQTLSAETARRGQDMTAEDAAARRAADAAKNPTSQQSKVQDAQEALRLIEDASAALKKSTGSYVGAGLDTLAQAFGYATPGAQASAQLKAIEGMLVSKMPKMSGPQSDADVKLYRQMAGTIGDPTVPNETKVAALETIKAIQERYAGVQSEPKPASSQTKPPKAGDVMDGYRFKGGNPADKANWEKV